jgi:hypothetical protein
VPQPPLDAKLALFENPHALPRAFTVYRVRPAPPTTELLGRLSDPGFDPLVESYVEGDPGTMSATGAPERGGAATFVRDEELVVELDVHLEAPGLVVLADTFYPGWRATVDGKPAAILAVNHLFRGVQAGSGRHRVRFDYRPWRTMAGAAISLAASAMIALMCSLHGIGHLAGDALWEAGSPRSTRVFVETASVLVPPVETPGGC